MTIVEDLITDANKEIPSNMMMQMAPPGSQISYYCKWRHLVDKFLTNASGALPTNSCTATYWLNLLAIRYLQLWCQPMGPLCLWQCLLPVRDPNLWYLIFFVTCSRTGEAERNLASEHLGCRQPSSPFPFLQITFNSVCGNLLNLVLCQRFKTLSNSIRL